MSDQETLYKLLQVDPTAEDTIIRYAYRYLAAKFHPDNSETGNKLKFDQITEAWKILGDANHRAAYDASLRKSDSSTSKKNNRRFDA